MKVVFRSTRPAWSKRQYRALLAVLWVYTFVWLVALIVVNFLLPLGVVAKAVITLFLVVVTPTDGHFMSYEKYRRWHAEHVVVTSQGSTG
jgi:type IV secretory pathway component VirB8